MQRNSGPKLLPLFIILVVVVIAVVGVVSIGRAVFFSGDDTQTTDEPSEPGRTQLLDTSVGQSVRMSVRGPLVSEEEFTSYKIEVAPSAREYVVYGGYLDEVESRRSLDNTQPAYEEFVYALDKANLMKGEVPADDDQNDLRGICATGYVYEYSVISGESPVKRLWTSSCDGSKGTLDASLEQINNLFYDQIPEVRDDLPFKRSFGIQSLRL